MTLFSLYVYGYWCDRVFDRMSLDLEVTFVVEFFVYLCVCLPVCLFVCVFVYLCLFTCVFVYLCVWPCVSWGVPCCKTSCHSAHTGTPPTRLPLEGGRTWRASSGCPSNTNPHNSTESAHTTVYTVNLNLKDY